MVLAILPSGLQRALPSIVPLLLLLVGLTWPATIAAQAAAPSTAAQPETGAEAADDADARFEDAFDKPPAEATAAATAPLPKAPAPQALNLLDLAVKGGYLMIPLGIMSLIVAFFGFERWIGLRRNRIVPPEFVEGLGQLANRQGGLDPRLAYRLCQKYKCAASKVVRAALLKVGRPHSEVEKAVNEASEREAEELYANVRPIVLAMGISPLLGLLGTVWGMVETFFTVSQSTQTVKVAELAGGIYVALVTTVAGLTIAIPAALLAHYYEGRIRKLFRIIDDLVQSILPQLERYEGKLRVTTLDLASDAAPTNGSAAPAAAAQPPVPPPPPPSPPPPPPPIPAAGQGGAKTAVKAPPAVTVTKSKPNH